MNQNKSVVITGASSGIGKASVQHLDKKGFAVFAAVRNKKDLEMLAKSSSERVHPILMDVTQPETIRAAALEVEKNLNSSGLDGLVNNAGTNLAGPLEYLDIEAFREQMEVNVTGQLRVTQAFLPLLKKAKGRIIMMGSASGINALPLIGSYCASKFALEAISDVLRMELAQSGVDVSIIEPGSVRTSIMEKGSEAIEKTSLKRKKLLLKEYGDLIKGIRSGFRASKIRGAKPEVIARMIEHVLTARRPKTRYLVGKVAYLRAFAQMLPDRIRDAAILWIFKKRWMG